MDFIRKKEGCDSKTLILSEAEAAAIFYLPFNCLGHRSTVNSAYCFISIGRRSKMNLIAFLLPLISAGKDLTKL